jgi:hypothetical protein
MNTSTETAVAAIRALGDQRRAVERQIERADAIGTAGSVHAWQKMLSSIDKALAELNAGVFG